MIDNFQIEIEYTDQDTISCMGDGPKESHPLIYLDLSSGKIITCPYCSKKFKKNGKK